MLFGNISNRKMSNYEKNKRNSSPELIDYSNGQIAVIGIPKPKQNILGLIQELSKK